jgi:hypothetical protein
MSKFLTPNRVAAIATWLTGLAAFIASIVGTLPQGWQNAALGAAGLLTSAVTTLHYMTGSQKFDALQAQVDPAAIQAPPTTPASR